MTDLARLAQLCTIIDHLEARPDHVALHFMGIERDTILGEYVAEYMRANDPQRQPGAALACSVCGACFPEATSLFEHSGRCRTDSPAAKAHTKARKK